MSPGALLGALALSIAPLASLVAQQPSARPPFLTGMCATAESNGVVDSIVEHPERAPAFAPGATLAPFPDTLHRLGYEGTVVTAVVVDSSGAVRPGAVAVMSSTDPVLSRWACDAVPAIRFVPAWNGGRHVASQVTIPFTYRVPIPNPVYIELQVEKEVEIAQYLRPRYPEELRQANAEGEVLASFVVDTSGRADMETYSVLRSSEPRFNLAVRAAVSGMLFRPAELGGRKVRQRVQLPFTFALEGEPRIVPRQGARPVIP